MNVTEITMDPEAAQAKLAAARRQIRRFRNPQPRLEALRDGYAALAAGTPVIMLRATIAAGGWDEAGRPRLAVARSDRRRVAFRISSSWSDRRACVQFLADARSTSIGWSGAPGPTLRRSVPLRLFPPREVNMRKRGIAIVPMVPPDIVEAAGNPSLPKCFTLWEADWQDVPVDPMLLRHLGGDLYAVLAQWDLTELERTVLAGEVDD